MLPLIALIIKEPARTIVEGHLGHRFVALGKIAVRPAILLLSFAHITLLLSFVAMYTALGPHLAGLNLSPATVIALRLVGLPGMFMALLVGPLAARIGMPGVASAGYLVAAVGLALEAVLAQSLTGIAIGSLVFVVGVALAIPAMITQFGDLAVPNRAAGMALNGFVLFIGASIGPFIVSWCPVSSRYWWGLRWHFYWALSALRAVHRLLHPRGNHEFYPFFALFSPDFLPLDPGAAHQSRAYRCSVCFRVANSFRCGWR